eukprot:1392436-Prymnesium_polylepis.1
MPPMPAAAQLLDDDIPRGTVVHLPNGSTITLNAHTARGDSDSQYAPFVPTMPSAAMRTPIIRSRLAPADQITPDVPLGDGVKSQPLSPILGSPNYNQNLVHMFELDGCGRQGKSHRIQGDCQSGQCYGAS